MQYPVDAPRARVLKALSAFGFVPIRHSGEIILGCGGRTVPLPNHLKIKSTTLRRIVKTIGIDNKTFLETYVKS